jgi:preprotein translocase subunit SecE
MATADIENVTTPADKFKLVLSIGLVLAGLGGFYLLRAQGVWVQWGVLLAGLVAAVAVFLVSIHGRQLIGYGRDSWRELQKVVWPTRKESLQMTAYVFGFVVLMALFLWLTDKTLEWVLYDLILGWKK